MYLYFTYCLSASFKGYFLTARDLGNGILKKEHIDLHITGIADEKDTKQMKII
jgi:hypothetical protein